MLEPIDELRLELVDELEEELDELEWDLELEEELDEQKLVDGEERQDQNMMFGILYIPA